MNIVAFYFYIRRILFNRYTNISTFRIRKKIIALLHNVQIDNQIRHYSQIYILIIYLIICLTRTYKCELYIENIDYNDYFQYFS